MDLNKDVPAKYGLIGDAKLTLTALQPGDGRTRQVDGAAPRRRSGADRRAAQGLAGGVGAEARAATRRRSIPTGSSRELNRLVDKAKTIITHDAGSPRDQMTPFWESTAPLTYIGWGKTTQLGYGLGFAMGAKLARPDHLCINVWGDAAIGFTGMDLETAARERIPILSILFNNFSMAIEIPIMPVSQAKYGSTDISGNYADMAKAFGCYGERITDPGDIVAALKRGIAATEQGQPALLEFITDKEITISNE